MCTILLLFLNSDIKPDLKRGFRGILCALFDTNCQFHCITHTFQVMYQKKD